DSGVNKTHTQDRFALKFVKDSSAVAGSGNPLLAPWDGPFGGVPPFGKFKVADIKSAMEEGIAQELADIDGIANDSEPPGFANTIAAMERAGLPLSRAGAVYGIYTSTMNDEEMQKIQSDISPKLAALQDKIVQNPKLFARIAAVYEKRDGLRLSPEQQRLLWLDYTGFVRQGAKLDDAAKKQLADLNQQLATLSTKFTQNLLAEEGTQMVLLEIEADLAGLPPALREQAAAAAASKGKAWKPAVQRVHEEVADMQAIADKERAGVRIQPWDYLFYSEKVRKAKYDLDENDVKPYLQMEKLREGMFWVAGQLFGLKFVPITD